MQNTSFTLLEIEQLIAQLQLNGCEQSLAQLNVPLKLEALAEAYLLKVKLPFAYQTNKFLEQLEQHLKAQEISIKIELELTILIPHYAIPNKSAQIKGVKNIIAVSSAKGGVGKSTTAVNLALALQHLGLKVGLLDADIYGPSIPHMLGQENSKPQSLDQKTMQPIEAYGITTNSIGYLIGAMDPTIWRGPVASTMLLQLLNETNWAPESAELDFLIIDMPPGTGDLQLTLAQKIPVSAGVIVTTPQEIALLDVVKGINMFKEVTVPVVGLLENMSYHKCSNCGHLEAIFGLDGGKDLAELADIKLLGTIPLAIEIRRDLDQGLPTMIANPTSELAQFYLDAAVRVTINCQQQLKVAGKTINIKHL